MTNPASENFFAEESEAMYYALGIAYATYTPERKRRLKFINEDKPLLEILKSLFGNSNKVIKYNERNSYVYTLTSEKLRQDLESRISGFGNSRLDYEFPEMKRKYHRHFIRGVLDARARFYEPEWGGIEVRLSFNKAFLKSLNDILVKEGGVEHDDPVGNVIAYGYANSLKIYEYIYQDVVPGIYLPSNKDAFVLDYKREPIGMTDDQLVFVQKVKAMSLAGHPGSKIADELKYSSPDCIFTRFKRLTTYTVGQFLQMSRVGPV